MTDTLKRGQDFPGGVRWVRAGTFTPELKRKTVQLLASVSRSASALACELGIQHNQLYTWQREFQGSGERKARTTELARLKRELAHVTEERAIVINTAAYFARESK